MKLSNINVRDFVYTARNRVSGILPWVLIQGNAYLRLTILLVIAIIGVIIIANTLYGSTSDVTVEESSAYTLDTATLDRLELWIEERHAKQQAAPTVRSSAFQR